MLNVRYSFSLAIVFLVLGTPNCLAQPVIPGSVGFGLNTPAGRGGQIVKVTNLNDAGQGSLRACVEKSGPRVCAFEVSGTIRLASPLTVTNPFLTIAGQTAPSPGILLRDGSLAIRASDVLVQHLTVRVGDAESGQPLYLRDALKVGGNSAVRNVVIDHCSLSWSIDEVIEIWGDWDDVSVSNSILSEPLKDPSANNGSLHGYGALIDATRGNISLVGNLFAHAHNRNPRSAAQGLVFVNNVIYNAGDGNLNLFNKDGISSKNAVVGNVFLGGPDTSSGAWVIRLSGLDEGNLDILKTMVEGTGIYLADNLAPSSSSDPWSIVVNSSEVPLELLRVTTAPIWPTGLSAMETRNDNVRSFVLENAGSRPADRNQVDERIIRDVSNGTGKHISCVEDDGSVRCKNNGGGWPNLAKNVRQLNLPSDPNGDSDGDGYTNVEEWLHAMAADVEGRSSFAPLPDDPAPPKPPQLQD